VSSSEVLRKKRDPAIVAATTAKPGIVLRRPVGSNGPFSEHAELPKDTFIGKVKGRPAKPQPKTKEPARKIDDKAGRDAALAFEREQKRRENARRKEEAAWEKERKWREQAIAKAERALEQAKREHEERAGRSSGKNWKPLCAGPAISYAFAPVDDIRFLARA
jgi:colicin import membrane protein